MVRTDGNEGLNPPLIHIDQHVDKPMKAVLGLGLLLAIALVLYGFNAGHHADATRMSATHMPSTVVERAMTPASSGFDTAHLAPREDNSLR